METKCVNKVQVAGRLVADPQLRHTKAGLPVTTLRVVTTYRARDGKERREYIRCTLWGTHAAHVAERLHNNDWVAVEGKLRSSTWVDAKGQKRWSTSVDGHVLSAEPNSGEGCEEFPEPALDEDGPHIGSTSESRSEGTCTSEWFSPSRSESVPSGGSESAPPASGYDTARCTNCGDLMIRNGACYVCPSCGATTRCA